MAPHPSSGSPDENPTSQARTASYLSSSQSQQGAQGDPTHGSGNPPAPLNTDQQLPQTVPDSVLDLAPSTADSTVDSIIDTTCEQHESALESTSNSNVRTSKGALASTSDPDDRSPTSEPGPVTVDNTPDRDDPLEQNVKVLLNSPTCSLDQIMNAVILLDVLPQSVSIDQYAPYDHSNNEEKSIGLTKQPIGSTKVTEAPSTGIQTHLPALSNLQEIFEDIARKVIALNHTNEEDTFENLMIALGGRKLRVGTMCSGTESPILALTEFRLASKRIGLDCFDFVHEFSCEIETFKQSYIQRNFRPPIIFRDVREFKEVNDTNTPQDQGEQSQTATPQATSVYKVRHDIPSDLDILIAGFSCIDFSNLNSKKKRLEDNGQSGQTFFGILAYVKLFRPRIIVLENISGCPWDKVIGNLEEIGYFAGHIRVDTRDYYLPQTRNRGYLVAFDAEHDHFAGSSGALEIGSGLVQIWSDLMLGVFKRPASSPFLSYIMEDGDPRLMLIKQRLSHDSSFSSDSDKEYDWIQCRGRHEGVRLNLGLGWDRPQTNWKSNGGCKVRDHFWVNWAKRQPERILDTLDISYLRKLKVYGIDQNFKPRILDLNQNVDREQDRRQPGIFPCVLPRGRNFLTTRGGIITGLEALAIQGIPVDSLNLTKETNSQLQDLAGNAMSSTVVGCAILSALIAGSPLLEGQKSIKPLTLSTKLPNFLEFATPKQQEGWELEAKHVSMQWNSNLSLHNVGVHAAQSVQQCACEGQSLMKDREFLLCLDCGFGACVSCGGNPRHNYKILDKNRARVSPIIFEQTLRRELPAVIELQGLSIDALGINELLLRLPQCKTRQLATKTNDQGPSKSKRVAPKKPKPENATVGGMNTAPLYQTRVWTLRTDEALPTINDYQKLFDCDNKMRLTTIKRTRYWTVTYENEKMRADLIIRPKMSQAFADVHFKQLPEISTFEWFLFFKPLPREPLASEISKAFALPRARMIPNTQLLEGRWELYQPVQLSYELHLNGIGDRSDCWECRMGIETEQQVFSKLNVSLGRGTSASRTYLPREIQQIEGDYEWLPSCGGPNGSLHKQILHEGSPTLEPAFLFLDPAPITTSEGDCFVFAKDHGRLNFLEHRQTICKVGPTWKPGKVFQSRCSPLEDQNLRENLPFGSVYLSKIETDGFWVDTSSLKLKAVDVTFDRWLPSRDSSIIIDHDSCRNATQTLLSFETIIGESQGKVSQPNQRYDLDLTGKPAELSFLTWQIPILNEIAQSEEWKEVMIKNAPSTSKQIHHCKICTLPSKEVKFEDWQNFRGKSTRIATETDFNTMEDEFDAKHRPAAISGQILRLESSRSYIRIDGNVQTLLHRACGTILDLNMMKGHDTSISNVRWRIARDDSSRYGLKFDMLTLEDNKKDLPASQPPSFTKNLRPDQLRSLGWMLYRERLDGRSFENTIVEEACLPSLNARLEVQVNFPISIRGGIVADEVGYGKTAVVLGLIDSTWQSSTDTRVHKELSWTKATLVLVPNIIADQWESEYRFFHDNEAGDPNQNQPKRPKKSSQQDQLYPEIVVYKQAASIKFDQIQRAKVVVVSHSVLGSTYEAKLGPSSPPPKRHGREYDQWLSEVLGKLTTPEDTASGPPEVHDQGPSSHDGGQKGKKRSHGRKTAQSSKRQKTLPKGNKLDVLHAFHWSRVVIDEFTYLEGKACQMASKISAEAKWIMSGTPDLTNFSCVNEMAGFLGVSLGQYDDREGLSKAPGTLETISQELTFVEQFQLLEEVRSAHWHYSRHQHAQEFLNFCACQNRAEIETIKSYEHYQLINLAPPERFYYSAVVSHLMSRDMGGRTKKKEKKDLGNPIKEHIKELISSCSVTTEALFRSCSTAPPVEAHTCDSLIVIKSRELAITAHNLYTQLQFCWHLHTQSASENLEEKPFLNFLKCIAANAYGDGQAMVFVNKLIQLAKENMSCPTETLDATQKRNKKAVLKPKATKQASVKGKQKAQEAEEFEDDHEADDSSDELLANAVNENDVAEEDTKPLNNTQKDLFHRANYTTDQTLNFVDETRALRQLLVIDQYSNDSEFLRDCPKCGRERIQAAEISINVACGHTLCHRCAETALLTERRMCGLDGCTAGVSQNCVIPASQFCNTGLQYDAEKCSKFERVGELIKDESQIKHEEKVIIFVQYDDLVEALGKALKGHKISYKSIGGKGGGDKLNSLDEKSLKDFQDLSKNIKVCILRSDSPSSAGLNLQCANHVMFVSTLLTNSRQTWQATMTQMIGRVKRFQQRREVHIWNILAANTIDVNELQERTNCVLKAAGAEVELGPLDDQFGRRVKVAGWEGEFSGAVIKSDASYMGELAMD